MEKQPDQVIFRACTDAQIEMMARRNILASAPKQAATRAIKAGAGILIGIGAACMFLGPSAMRIGIAFLAIALGLVLFMIWESFRHFTGPVDTQQLAGEKAKLRALHMGRCPACNRTIFVNANQDPKQFSCPSCKAELVFQDRSVSLK